MVKSIVIRGADLITDEYNDTYRYKFPAGQVQFKGHSVAVGSVSIYNSFYNISSALQNNTFTYHWSPNDITADTTNGSTLLQNVSSLTGIVVGQYLEGTGIPANTTVVSVDNSDLGNLKITMSNEATANGTGVSLVVITPVTIPDGQYTINQINAFLQFTFIQNTHYLVDGSGNYVYFYEILWNPTKNLVELVSYPIPTALGTYTFPPGATWSLPATAATPQLTLTKTSITNGLTNLTIYYGLGALLGFDSGTYPSAVQTSTYNVLATYTDEVYSINAISLGCNLLSNNLSVPQSLLYSLPINEYAFGEAIVDKQGSYAYVPILDGIYPDIVIRFYDQNGNRLRVRDTDIVVYLLIKAPEETGI